MKTVPTNYLVVTLGDVGPTHATVTGVYGVSVAMAEAHRDPAERVACAVDAVEIGDRVSHWADRAEVSGYANMRFCGSHLRPALAAVEV